MQVTPGAKQNLISYLRAHSPLENAFGENAAELNDIFAQARYENGLDDDGLFLMVLRG